MNIVAEKPKRPSSITLIRVFAIYAGILSFYYVFRDGANGLGLGNTLFFILGGIIFLVCGISFWMMKKWAVYTYMGFVIIDQIILLLIGRWNLLGLLIAIVVIYVGYRHLSKMS